MGDVVKAIVRSKRNIFPIVDQYKHLHGIILLNDIREMMFDREKYDVIKAKTLAHAPPATVFYDENIEDVLKKFEQTKDWNLPVINRNRHYMGIVSKSSIFSVYRNTLIKLADV